MSQVTGAMSINDSALAAKSFSPVKVTPEETIFAEKTVLSQVGWKQITVRFSPASAKRQTSRIDFDLDMPVTQTVNGIVSLAYTLRYRSYAVIPTQATQLERYDAYAFFTGGLNVAGPKAVFRDLDPLY